MSAAEVSEFCDVCGDVSGNIGGGGRCGGEIGGTVGRCRPAVMSFEFRAEEEHINV